MDGANRGAGAGCGGGWLMLVVQMPDVYTTHCGTVIGLLVSPISPLDIVR